MKNLKIILIGAGMLAMSTVETLARVVDNHEVVIIEAAADDFLPSSFSPEVTHLLEAASLSRESITRPAEVPFLKVPIYSVALPDENKIVLVKDPKGFVEQAIRHGMEFIAIKPMVKGEFWELVPVFSTEKALSFNPKSSVQHASEEEMELLRIVPVAGFIRYN